NHYRLQTDAEAPPDSLDHPLALGQLGGGMRNCAVIDLPAEPVPYEAGRKFLHRFEIAAAGARMARRPGEISMRAWAQTFDVAKKGGHGRGIEMIEIQRAVVDHEVKWR